MYATSGSLAVASTVLKHNTSMALKAMMGIQFCQFLLVTLNLPMVSGLRNYWL